VCYMVMVMARVADLVIGRTRDFAQSRMLAIAMARHRDGQVVEGARLENEACEQRGATPKRLNAHAISDLTPQNYLAMCVRKPRCSSRF
jgi:hypothetical protein